jgi:hypothetical protein
MNVTDLLTVPGCHILNLDNQPEQITIVIALKRQGVNTM